MQLTKPVASDGVSQLIRSVGRTIEEREGAGRTLGGRVTRAFYFAAGVFVGILPLSLAEASPQDPVAVSPRYYSVRFENDRVRVLEYRLKPGEREGTHTHAPGIVYVLADSTIRTTLPDGTVADRPAKAGEVFWQDATSRSVVNVGQTEAHALAIDLKQCRP